jgi:hypothetical protein
MPNFRVHPVGSEKLRDFHRANFEAISRDPVLQERYADKLDALKTQLYPPTPVFKQKTSQPVQSSDPLQPVDDILNNITKDDVKKSKKKKTELTSFSSSDDTNGNSNGYVKPDSRFVHSSNYYTKKSDSITHAIRISLYNKAFERDMF